MNEKIAILASAYEAKHSRPGSVRIRAWRRSSHTWRCRSSFAPPLTQVGIAAPGPARGRGRRLRPATASAKASRTSEKPHGWKAPRGGVLSLGSPPAGRQGHRRSHAHGALLLMRSASDWRGVFARRSHFRSPTGCITWSRSGSSPATTSGCHSAFSHYPNLLSCSVAVR
jgi:hypothetical protein